MQHSLEKLRHGKFAAILVDRKCTHADVLEFILNVRDINENISVIVIGTAEDERIDKTILEQDHTIILNEVENKDRFAEKLAQALNRSDN
jgi:two-component SAPR family response regulator